MPDLSSLDQARRRREWRQDVADERWGPCDECGEMRQLVIKHSGRRWLCLECWERLFR